MRGDIGARHRRLEVLVGLEALLGGHRRAGRASALEAAQHPMTELARHETVDDGIQAGVDKGQRVRDDAHRIGGVVECGESEHDVGFHQQTRSPAHEKQDDDQDQHFNYLE